MKKNFICKCKKTASGVTLIALIVTVIVALILAGVGIVTLTSKDEVIEKSKLAKEKIEGYTEKESDIVKDTLKYPNSSDCKHKNIERRNATGTFSGDTYCLDCGVLLATGTIQPCETHPTTIVTEAVAATCCSKGNTGNIICTVCGFVVTPGNEIDYNTSNHVGGTEIRNKTDSYTGDTYCLGCGALLAKGKVSRIGLEVGDYVNYTYDTVTSSYFVSGTYSRYRQGSSTTIDQNIPQTTSLKWRVLSINDDGSIDLISDTDTETMLYLEGADGYNNGVFYLDDICKSHYSNTALGVEARNLKIEDMEKTLNTTGKSARTNAASNKIYISSNYYYPLICLQEKNYGLELGSLNTTGIGPSEAYYTQPVREYAGLYSRYGYNYGIVSGGFRARDSYNGTMVSKSYFDDTDLYDMFFNTSNNYWISTRTFSGGIGYYGMYYVEQYSSSYSYADLEFQMLYGWYAGKSSYDGHYLRPVVTLNPSAVIDLCDGTNSATNMHTIVSN